MEGITVDTCSLDGSRQTSYIQLLSLANSDVLSSATTNGSKPTIRIQPASLVVQNNSSKKTFAIPSNSNSDFSRLNLEGTRTTETILCAYDNQQKTLTVLGSTNFGRNLFTLSRSEDADRNDNATNAAETTSNAGKTTSSKKSARYKGGWPKGRRRRKVHPNAKTPKQPSTAYNLFCNQRRSVVKLENPDLSLAEIMKILGKDWSTLPKIDKQKFIESADADMERYKKELSAYKNSSEYQEFLKSEKTLNFSQNSNEFNRNVDGQCEEFTSTTHDLHCKDCDIYFHNIHNKVEHIRGKAHRKNTIKKFEDFWTKKTKSKCTSCDHSTNQFKQPLIMEELLIYFFERNREQELELNELQVRVQNYKEKNTTSQNMVNFYESDLTRLHEELKTAVNERNLLQKRLSKLNLVKHLFQNDKEVLSV